MSKTRWIVSTRLFCVVLPFVLLAVTLGCKKGYQGGEKLYPVTVTVLDGGKPVDNAVVILDRQGADKVNASAMTDPEGKASIKIDAEWPGAPVGKYLVRVLKEPPFTPDLTPEEVAKLEPNQFSEYEEKMQKKRSALKPVVPAIVGGTKTPFEMEVTASKTNEASFDIAEHW